MDAEIKKRLMWMKLYEETGDAGPVCRRCGISRPTLRKWWERFQAQGEAGLVSRSHRPKTSPNRKVFEQEEAWILDLRRQQGLGVRRIQNELKSLYNYELGLASIKKVLGKHQLEPIKKLKRKQKFRRYQRPIPGGCVQMETCKIAHGLYQYTAIDDYSRMLVLALYSRRTAIRQVVYIQRHFHLLMSFGYHVLQCNMNLYLLRFEMLTNAPFRPNNGY